jgi:hypothetical protein
MILQEEVQLTLEVAEDLLTGQDTMLETADLVAEEKVHHTVMVLTNNLKTEQTDLVAAVAALNQEEAEMV